jgi:hypothetical protein
MDSIITPNVIEYKQEFKIKKKRLQHSNINTSYSSLRLKPYVFSLAFTKSLFITLLNRHASVLHYYISKNREQKKINETFRTFAIKVANE